MRIWSIGTGKKAPLYSRSRGDSMAKNPKKADKVAKDAAPKN
ncbi:MAG: hypothetical protein AB9860_01010 [Methanomassiliicoccales archaeon]